MMWTITVTNRTSRFMVGPGGKFKTAVMLETGVDIDVVPLTGMLGTLWTIVGSDDNIKLAIEYLHSIYQNTVVKNGKATEPSPFKLNKLTRSQEIIKEKEEMTRLLAEEKLNVERVSKERERDATETESKLHNLNRSIRVKELLLKRKDTIIQSKEQELANTKQERSYVESELITLKQELANTKQEMRYVESELITSKQELATTRQKKYSLESDLFTVKRQLITTKQELATIQLESERERGILESEMFALETELASTKEVNCSLESELFSVKQELEDTVKELKKKDEEIILLKQLEACDETNDKLTKAIESMEEADKQYKKVETDVATLTRKVMLMEEGGKKAGVTLCNTVAKLSENADKIQKAVKVVENTCLNNEGTIKELEKNLGSTIKMAADNEHKLDELSRKLETGGEQLKKEVVVKVVQTLSILKSGNE